LTNIQIELNASPLYRRMENNGLHAVYVFVQPALLTSVLLGEILEQMDVFEIRDCSLIKSFSSDVWGMDAGLRHSPALHVSIGLALTFVLKQICNFGLS